MGNIPSADKTAMLQVKLKDLKVAIASGAKLLTFSSLRSRPNGRPYTDSDLERARLAVSNLRAYTPAYHNKIPAHTIDTVHQAAVEEEEHQIHDLLHLSSNDSQEYSNHTTTAAPASDKKCVRFADTEQVMILDDPLPSLDQSLDQLPPMGPLKVLDRDVNGSFGFELLVGNPEVGIRVFSVNDGSPAALKGVLVDSIIMQVDGVITYGLAYSEINDLLAKAGPFVSVRFGQQQVTHDPDEEVANLKLQAYFKHVIHQKREREGLGVDPSLAQRLLEDSNEDEGGLLELSPLDSQSSRRRKPKNFRKINASQLGSKPMTSAKTTPRHNSAYGHSYVKKKKPLPKSAITSKPNSPSSPHVSTTPMSSMWSPPAHAPMFSSTPPHAENTTTHNNTSTPNTSNNHQGNNAQTTITPPMSKSYTRPMDDGTPAHHATFDFDSATIYQPNYDNLDEDTLETDSNNTTSEFEHRDRRDYSYDNQHHHHHHEQEHSSQTSTMTADKGLTPEVVSKKKRFDNTRYGAPLETGVTMKVVGSKHHPQMMGNYKEMEGEYNSTPVFCKIDKTTQDILFCLYYHDKSWRISSAVGKKKCTISTTSPATRPDKAKSIWYEARGPNGHTMQGHPGISCKLQTSDGASEGVRGSRRVYVNRKLKLPQ
eukprot:m.44916 g.44916  ORF g.44916 m.44916 type:complete len:652 (-) comp19816_c0_seq1:545-2500(-)